MQDKGPMLYVRSKELLLRWIEFSAFGSALFRSHVGSNTSPLNSQIYQDEETLTHFAHFSRIFAHLAEYRGVLMTDAEIKGWPLMRQMAAHYAHDEITWELTDQYMFGSEILVAPVLNPVGSESSARVSVNARNGGMGKDLPVSSVKVYLPAKSVWIHVWTGQTVHAGDDGRYVSVDAPIGYPPVFYIPSSMYGLKLREFVVSNNYHATYSEKDVPKDVSKDTTNVPMIGSESSFIVLPTTSFSNEEDTSKGTTSSIPKSSTEKSFIIPAISSSTVSLNLLIDKINTVQLEVHEGAQLKYMNLNQDAVSLIYTCDATIGTLLCVCHSSLI
jgi:alpha-glucosidase (family GH31 glycosyl hydrolase)